MSDRFLEFISNEDLERHTREVIDKSQRAAESAAKDLHKNVIDPFSALFDSARQGITVDQWIEQEKARQVQKTLQNALGAFHQKIIGSIDGWHDTGAGGSFDVENKEKKIIAEIKNKHNTMNASSSADVYQKLASHLRFSHKDHTAYLVDIVPKTPKPYDKEWSPNQGITLLREDIRRIDGRSFYALATGRENALNELYNALPLVIEQILGAKARKVDNTKEFAALFERAYSL